MKEIFKLIVKNLREYVPLNVFRGGQETVYSCIRDAITQGIRTMYIEGPTGMGKSFIQSTLADAIIKGSDLQVLLLVPKIILLTQMQREFVKFTRHLVLGLVGNGHKSYHNQVTVMTYQSFLNIKNEALQRYAVFFLDEAHKALGEKTRGKINEQKHAIIIGFTATPTYDEKKNLKEFLKYEAYRISIPEAVKVGMLSAVQFIIGKVQIEIYGKRNDENSKDYLERMGKDIIRQGGNIAAAKLYKKIFEKRGIRFIMFTASVNQGRNLVTELRSNGISAEIITGEMRINDREELFKRFANNEFKVLVGIDTIKEGFDDPGVHGVLYAYPVGSMVDLIQGAGRATRIHDSFPEKVAYIVQLMFKGRRQVWYNDALEGKGPFVAHNEEFTDEVIIRNRFNVVGSDDLDGISDEVIESVSVDYEEIFNLIRDYKKSEEGFYSTWQEASEVTLGIGIKNHREYLESHYKDPRLPRSLVKVYKNFPGMSVFFKKPTHPDGWRTASSLMSDYKTEHQMIKKFVERFRKDNPEWFKQFWAQVIFVEYYHPDLVVKIKSFFKERVFAPEGWGTADSLQKFLRVNRVTIKKFVAQFRTKNADWFKVYWTSGINAEHYHPKLMEIIKENYSMRTAPNGWMTVNQTKKQLDFKPNPNRVTDYAEQFRREHPEWFKSYLSGTHYVEHYHPKLVKLIRENVKKTLGN